MCDVRKNPISRKHCFSKRQLEKAISNIGIKYMQFLNFKFPLTKDAT
ncbi:DUF488 family protein [Bartonella elizabethae]|nr:DUF488 family protein [Bartonella elizabethae]